MEAPAPLQTFKRESSSFETKRTLLSLLFLRTRFRTPAIALLIASFISLVPLSAQVATEEIPALDDGSSPEAPVTEENIPEETAAEEPLPAETPATTEGSESTTPAETAPESTEDEDRNIYKGDTKRAVGDAIFYTYFGGMMSFGANTIWYEDWIDEEQKAEESSGYHITPVSTLLIIVDPFVAHIDLGFRFNINDKPYTQIHHTYFDSKLKYQYKLGSRFALCGGLGFYFESFPSSEQYDGVGGLVSAGGYYQLNSQFIILADFDFGFGDYGKGTESGKVTYGLSAGAVKRVGNL